MEPKWVLKWDYNIPNGYIELETELIDVEFKHVTESNEEEIKEYQNNLFGILKIINYENPV